MKRDRPRSRSRWPYFQRSKAVGSSSRFLATNASEIWMKRDQPRTRSRWPHFQRCKAVRSSFRPRSHWPYFQRSKAVHSSFRPSSRWPYYVANFWMKLSPQTPFTLAILSTALSFRISGRISAAFQPKPPSACCYSAYLLCHRYIILYIIVLCVLHLL